MDRRRPLDYGRLSVVAGSPRLGRIATGTMGSARIARSRPDGVRGSRSTSESTMSSRPFVHLHCHSHYSLLDGASKIPDLFERTKALGMPALALTDHGNLYGAVEFLREAKAAGILPIVGLEAYVAPGSEPSGAAAACRARSMLFT